MPVNDFEKRVQEEMEEFKIRPSDSVWQNVQEELHGKRKRRVVFYIILLAGLGLAGFLAYNYSTGDHRTDIVNSNSNQQPKDIQQKSAGTTGADEQATESQKDASQQSLTTNSNKQKDNNDKTDSEENTTEANIVKDQKRLEEQSAVSSNKTVTTGKKDPNLTSGISTSSKNINKQNISGNTRKKDNQQSNNVADNNNRSSGSKQQRIKDLQSTKNNVVEENPSTDKPAANNLVSNNPSAGKPNADKDNETKVSTGPEIAKAVPTDKIDSTASAIASTNEVKQPAPDSTSNAEQPAPVIAKKKSKDSKFKFGLEIGAGTSTRRSGVSSLKTYSAVQMDQNLASAPGAGGPVFGSGIVKLPPSSVDPGFAFRIGVSAKMKLTERSSLVSGLRYAYLSDRIKIASSVIINNANLYQNNSFSAAYRSLQQKEYTNKYHFIELPLLFETRLNKGNKVGIMWNGGLSAGYLVSSNALIYDTLASGIYYKDIKGLNRFHVGLQTGFALSFGSKNKVQWSLGPDISFDMTRLIKQEAFDRNKYFMYGSITGRLYFGKPKK